MYPQNIARSRFGTGKSRMTISAAQLAANHFEVMALMHDGSELEIFTTTDKDTALMAYGQMIDRYEPIATNRKITPKMQKLIDALQAAKLAAHAVCDMRDDGGTSNFDSPALSLPRWAAADVDACAKAAGLRCFEWKLYGVRHWVLTVPEPCGQGNNRTRMAEAMAASLNANGFEAGMYYQMD